MTRQPNENELQQIKALLQAGQKEEATRIYQEITQTGIFIAQNAIKELEHTPDPLADIRLLVQQGEKIRAIKLYCERTGVSLKEGKRVIDTISDGTPTRTPILPTPNHSATDTGLIDQCILRGEKIRAVKLYREEHRVGLKEAKDAVEAREALLFADSAKQPQKYSDEAKNTDKQGASWGAISLMVLLLLVLICCYIFIRWG